MSSFHDKLDAALLEMAQLSSWHTSLGDDKEVDWTATYGTARKNGSFTVGRFGQRQRSEATEVAGQMLRQEVEDGGIDPGDYGVKDYEGLLSTLVLKPGESKQSFADRDIKALSSPRTRKAIEDYLNANPAGYKWNFLIIAVDRNAINTDDERVRAVLAKEYNIALDDHITFIKSGSSGDALTPGMIFHTAGHAVFTLPENTSRMADIYEVLNEFHKSISTMLLNDGRGPISDIGLLCQFLHFKAARSYVESLKPDLTPRKRAALYGRRLQSMNELIFEMAGVFIKRHKVRFSPNEYCRFTSDRHLRMAANVEYGVNAILRDVLDNCIGRIIVD